MTYGKRRRRHYHDIYDVCELFNAYVCRSSEQCFYELNLFSNPAFLWAIGGLIVVGQLTGIYFPLFKRHSKHKRSCRMPWCCGVDCPAEFQCATVRHSSKSSTLHGSMMPLIHHRTAKRMTIEQALRVPSLG